MSWQIAIDGPAGAGKSTIAKAVAQRLGFQYIDTGAMYRAVTLKALRRQINMYEKDEYNFLKDTVIDFKDDKIYLDGTCVSAEIRSLEVSNHVSIVAQIEYVREKLVLLQRNLAKEKDVIMDGRDIGTVVLPNADLKIYLNATVQERAKRRLNERLEKNQAVQTFAETIKEIIDRDYKDSNRSISPLVKAPDAIEIDSSELSVEAVIEKIINLFLERGYRMENLELNTKQEQKTEETKTNEKPVENIEKEEQPKKRTQVKANAEEEKPKEEPKKTTRVKKATPAAEEKTDITEEVEVEKPKKKTTAKTKKEDAVVAEQAEVTEEKAAPKKKTATKTKKEDAVVAEQAEVTEEKAAPKKKAATKTKKEDAVVAEQAEVTEEKAAPKKKAATKSKKEDVAETEAAPAAEVTPEAAPKMKPAAKSKKEASAEVEVAFVPEVSKADLKEPAEPAAASEVKSDETAP
ncbi:MAG: (d)CMP kinase, partial [Endomicrobiaceae bacterium]|nr:(d)CMP kinase [Endomicrobiaceae bacterium]